MDYYFYGYCIFTAVVMLATWLFIRYHNNGKESDNIFRVEWRRKGSKDEWKHGDWICKESAKSAAEYANKDYPELAHKVARKTTIQIVIG